jgi:nucleoside phosphorylase
MIPAFCFCSQFLDPLDAQERCTAIQKIRSAPESNFTDDIWDKDLIHDWAVSDDARLLMLQGNSRTTKRFERFALQIVEDIKSTPVTQPVRLVHVLNTPRLRGSSSQLAPSDLLQQVIVQCLQYVKPDRPVNFLIEILGRFRRATTASQEWFLILQDMCLLIPSLYIIVDLAILGRNFEETQLWPAYIQEMISLFNASRTGCRLKVMLLSCHRFTSQAGETLVINTQPPRSVLSPNRRQPRRHIRRIVEDPKSTPFNQDENPEAPIVHRSPPLNRERTSPSAGTRSGQTPMTTSARPSYITPPSFESPSPPEPLQRDEFNIAIICALTLESDAVQDVFDKQLDEKKYGKAPGDVNHYTMGVIGRHNVIVVHMPGMGKSNGARVAANCGASFPSLRLVLVVGICGGVPFTRGGAEIVLGDVVVSDGLIQYDFGRQFPDRFVRKNDTIARPNPEILSFLAKVKGRWGMKRLKQLTAENLKYLSNTTELGGIANYPGAWRDKLYESTYRHKHQGATDCEVCSHCHTKNDPVCGPSLTLDCEHLQCDEKHLIPRKRLTVVADENDHKSEPSIHFGLYASGDKVMKSGEERDIIAESEGVIAFEMEGSGVWEGFPGRCLVVKAVCDYADSHKNKRWQSYAAASAAAFTKAFLETWSC